MTKVVQVKVPEFMSDRDVRIGASERGLPQGLNKRWKSG